MKPEDPLMYEEDFPSRCEHPGCGCSGRLFFHQKCHPEAALDAYVLDGAVTLVCHECGQVVVKMKIASRAHLN